MKANAGYVKIVVLVVVLVVIAVGIVYVTSDVWRTKIRTMADQYAHWTPENIAKDPENYLNFCEQEANKALVSLKASEIAIAQNRGNFENMQKDASNKINLGTKALAELKDVFNKADSANAWPAEWSGQKRDKEWTKRQIVSLHRQVESQKTLQEKVAAGIKKLDAQVVRVQEGRSQTQTQLAEIKTGREILKVQRITDDLTKKLVSIKAVLQATVSTASETTGVITLDQLAAENVATVDEGEFQKIMGGK